MLLQIFSIENMKLINLRLSFEEHAVKDSIPKVNTVLNCLWFDSKRIIWRFHAVIYFHIL
jgi:hypothetical protein